MGLVSSQIALKKMVPVCRQISTAYDAGIPIINTLQLVARQNKDAQVRRMLDEMAESLRQGSSLADAARQQSDKVPPFFVQLMATGEHGGKLDIMLSDLADYFEARVEMSRAISKTMAYPCFMLIVAWFLGTFALRLVGEIPRMIQGTGARFEFEVFFAQYAWFQAKSMAVVAVIAAILIALARVGLLRWITGRISTFIWPLSIVTRKFALARFFRSMSLLITSGLNMMDCIRSAAATVSNPYIARDLEKAIPEVKKGATLLEAFGATRCLTPTAREMIAVGEESGNLDLTLRKVSQYHLAEATQAVSIAATVLKTLIMLVTGGLIGYVVILFWTRLYGGMLNAI